MLPRVIMDLSFASKSRTGTRVYAEQLCAALTALGEYQILSVGSRTRSFPSESAKSAKADLGQSLRRIPFADPLANLFSGARNLWWLQAQLPRLLGQTRAALVHAAAFLGPLRAPCPMVVNVFDTIYLDYPAEFDAKWHLYARFLIPPTVRRAAAIITLSRDAKRHIVQAFGVPSERVRVIPPGVGAEFRITATPAQFRETRAKFRLGERYLLFVGATEPRKNVASLVDALALVRHQFPDLELALVGPRGGGWKAIEDSISRHGLRNAVHELGFIASSDLASLYAGAQAFVFPSLAEGFGIPLIEAMASGTPVVVAPNAPTPEVVGDAACLALGSDSRALAEAVSRILSDPFYAADLVERGRAHAALYTWERAARETAQVYRDVLGK